jgi:hypothetical protein
MSDGTTATAGGGGAEARCALARVGAAMAEAAASAGVTPADPREIGRLRRLTEEAVERGARLDVGQAWINDALHPVAQPAVPPAGRLLGTLVGLTRTR